MKNKHRYIYTHNKREAFLSHVRGCTISSLIELKSTTKSQPKQKNQTKFNNNNN